MVLADWVAFLCVCTSATAEVTDLAACWCGLSDIVGNARHTWTEEVALLGCVATGVATRFTWLNWCVYWDWDMRFSASGVGFVRASTSHES